MTDKDVLDIKKNQAQIIENQTVLFDQIERSDNLAAFYFFVTLIALVISVITILTLN